MLATLKFAAITWFFTLVIGFTCSYFLVFHVKNLKLQIALFLLCTIPFWTSNVIRMISWVPVPRQGRPVQQLSDGARHHRPAA